MKKDTNNTLGEQFVNNAYKGLRNSLIIGLTGRTGSGCTTIASILSQKDFYQLDLKSPKQRDFADVEERKYAIEYHFMKQPNAWIPFTIVEGSSIIFSFLMEKDLEELIGYIEKGVKAENVTISDYSSLIEAIKSIGKENFKKQAPDTPEDIVKYYTVEVPQIKNLFYQAVSNYTCQVEMSDDEDSTIRHYRFYTYFMQTVGNNIRGSGNPYNHHIDSNHFYSVAERIDSVIRAIQEKNNKGGEPTRICIDTIRNPYEAFYFKDRYSTFYLVSVNVEDSERKRRLSNYTFDEINSLDLTESADGISSPFGIFYHQTISSCLEIADIHIYNKHIEDGKYYELTQQLIKYISLMLHPGLVTPSSVERCMQQAYNAKLNSGCLSRQVGAVITNSDHSIVAIGWNDVPHGQIPCNLRSICNYCIDHDENTYSKYELQDERFNEAISNIHKKIKVLSQDLIFPYCFKDVYNGIIGQKNQVHTRALHAEENAFLQISKYGGKGIEGGCLFVTASPCELCSKKAYNLGIKHIYYIDPYPGIAQSHILSFGKDHNPSMHLFYGAIGNAYISLYTQRISVKDELKIQTGINCATDSKNEAIYPFLGIDEALYCDREMNLTFISRVEMEETEKAHLSFKKQISQIIIPIVWTGDKKWRIKAFKLKTKEDSEFIDWKSNVVNNDFVRETGYISIDLKKVSTSNDEIINELWYEYTIIVNDSTQKMMPYYSSYIRLKTTHLKLTVSDPNEYTENQHLAIYAGKNMNKNYLVYEGQPEYNEEDNSWSIDQDKPNLLYTYMLSWDFKI